MNARTAIAPTAAATVSDHADWMLCSFAGETLVARPDREAA
ncbi:hypothetical protein [Rhizobium mesoamericanum]|nr:hypothetical protein [Rhizobium mesoamericanum]